MLADVTIFQKGVGVSAIEENRFATPEEQIILSKYVGWGGLSEAFDENNSAWATEYLELSSVLTPEEYASARESTLTAFSWTGPSNIRWISFRVISPIGPRRISMRSGQRKPPATAPAT